MSNPIKPSPEILKYIRENYTTKGGTVLNHKGKSVGTTYNDTHYRVSFEFNGKRRHVLRSHVNWYIHMGKWPERPVKHIDGDTFNDNINNLCYSIDFGGFSIEQRNNGKWRARNKKKGVSMSGFESREAAEIAVFGWLEEHGR